MIRYILLIIGIISTQFIFAQTKPTQGDGTAGNPFQVGTIEHLRWISNGGDDGDGDGTRWKYYYILTANIDATGSETWNENQGFRPIGNNSKTFRGGFDGQGYVISNLTINRPEKDYVGLFGKTANLVDGVNTEIKNIGLLNANISGQKYVGGIVGRSENTTVENAFTTGTIISAGKAAGGIVGENVQGSTVNKAYAFVNVTGQKNVGGIVGASYHQATVNQVYAVATISVTETDGAKGAVLGLSSGGAVTHAYWDNETETTSPEGTGLTTAEFADIANFTGFEDTWKVATLNTFNANPRPYFKSQFASISLAVNNDTYGTVSGAGDYLKNEPATISATANGNYEFVKWEDTDGNTYSTESEINITINEDISLTAIFELPTYTITVTAGANGAISPQTTTFNKGSDQTFSITADEGYTIKNVVVDGENQGGITSYSFTNIQANHTISAEFEETQLPSYTITVNSGENGSISPETTSVIQGGEVTFTITPNEGYQVKDVKLDNQSIGNVTSYTLSNVQANQTLTAEFEKKKYEITTTADANGSISPTSPMVEHGTDKTFTFTANAGYKVKDILVDGNSIGAVETYTFSNVMEAHSIEAVFEVLKYEITVTAGNNGAITPISAMVAHGADETFSITADAGYGIKDVLVDGQSQGAISEFTFTNVTEAHSIEAVFGQLFTITVTQNNNGTISPSTLEVIEGEDAVFSITPDNGYEVLGVLVDDTPTGSTANEYTIESVSKDYEISAIFGMVTALDLSALSIHIYPNPTTDYIFFENLPSDKKVYLQNLQGQVLITEKHPSKMDLTSLPAGMYLLNIEEVGTLKLLKK